MLVRLPCFAGARGTAGGWRRDSPVLAGAAWASPGTARLPKPRREVCFGRSFPGRLLLYIPGSTSPSLPARRGLGVEKRRQRHLPPTSRDEKPPNRQRGERLGWRSGDGGGGGGGGGIKAAPCCPRPAVIPGCKRAAGAAVRVCGCARRRRRGGGARPLPAGARGEPPAPPSAPPAPRCAALPPGCAHTRAPRPHTLLGSLPRQGVRAHIPRYPPGRGCIHLPPHPALSPSR